MSPVLSTQRILCRRRRKVCTYVSVTKHLQYEGLLQRYIHIYLKIYTEAVQDVLWQSQLSGSDAGKQRTTRYSCTVFCFNRKENEYVTATQKKEVHLEVFFFCFVVDPQLRSQFKNR